MNVLSRAVGQADDRTLDDAGLWGWDKAGAPCHEPTLPASVEVL